MLNFIFLLAQTTTPAAAEGAQQQSSWSFWVMMILIFVVFYFFMIRPQQKKQKELQKQRDALTKGNKVITAGGIYGVVKEIGDTEVVLEIDKNVRIHIDKNSIYASVADTVGNQAK